MQVLAPRSEAELVEVLATASAPLRVEGLGSKPFLGNPVAAKQTLSLRHFGGIVVYEPEELILEAGAATPLAEINALLTAKGQMLAFEPPDYASLMGSTAAGSLGGVVAAGLSGPRRIRAGAARDHVLGFSGVTGAGERIRAGARVVKNVTGYDLAKLATGSFGSLLAMTSVIVKVLPRPETEETIVLRGLTDAAAMAVMSEAMQSPADVSAAAHVPGEGTYLRLDGIAPSVSARRDGLLKRLACDAGIMSAAGSAELWRGLRDVKPFWGLKDPAIWRVSVAPSEGAAVAERISRQLNTQHFYDWAGGLIWLAVSGAADGGAGIIRACCTPGHATLVRAPDPVRHAVSAFQPQAPALAALSQRVKMSFDPRNILNPGIMARS